MTDFNFTPSQCYEKVEHINNNQVSLLSGSLSEEIQQQLLEYQADLIGDLSTMLLMLSQSPSLELKVLKTG